MCICFVFSAQTKEYLATIADERVRELTVEAVRQDLLDLQIDGDDLL